MTWPGSSGWCVWTTAGLLTPCAKLSIPSSLCSVRRGRGYSSTRGRRYIILLPCRTFRQPSWSCLTHRLLHSPVSVDDIPRCLSCPGWKSSGHLRLLPPSPPLSHCSLSCLFDLLNVSTIQDCRYPVEAFIRPSPHPELQEPLPGFLDSGRVLFTSSTQQPRSNTAASPLLKSPVIYVVWGSHWTGEVFRKHLQTFSKVFRCRSYPGPISRKGAFRMGFGLLYYEKSPQTGRNPISNALKGNVFVLK